MKIATVCSGIGSPEQALKQLNVPHEIVFACEKDKYARQTYLANFTPNVMYDDMTTQEWDLPEQYADLFIGGIPCQSFSLAGKRLGELDPRGLLFYDFYRYVKNRQPKIFIIENVKGLLSDANGTTFQNWVQLLGQSMNTHLNMFNHPDSLLYNLHFTVLNSKNFGVPQNRERVFLVGIRNDLPNTFRFPVGFRLDKRLKDILEPVVDERYYLSEKMITGLLKCDNGFEGRFVPKNPEDIGNCLTARYYKMGRTDNYIQEPQAGAIRGRYPEDPKSRVAGLLTEQMLEINSNPDITNTITTVGKDNVVIEPSLIKVAQLAGSHESSGRIYSDQGISPTVTAKQVGGHEPYIQVVDEVIQLNPSKESGGRQPYQHNRIYDADAISPVLDTECHRPNYKINHRIRRLTPLECFRLQGYSDTYIKPCSDSQTYKQAGNSITVNVIEAIIKNILPILI